MADAYKQYYDWGRQYNRLQLRKRLHTLGEVCFDLGLDKVGDMFYRGDEGNLVRVGIGTNGKVLTAEDGYPVWKTLPAPQNYSLPTATELRLGGIKVGNNLFVDSDGTLHAPAPTAPYTLPVATNAVLGGVRVGSNLTIDPDGTLHAPAPTPAYSLPIASETVLGGIKVGANLTIAADGTLSAPAPTPAYTLPTASATVLGGIKIGSNLTITADGTLSAPAPTPAYTLPVATASVLGGVKIGARISVAADGTISADIQPGTYSYTLPVATDTVLGGIKVGARLSITADGILSADAQGGSYTLPIASATVLGGVKIGNNITIDPDGTIHAPAPTAPYTLPTASTTVLGGIKVGARLSITDGVLSADVQSSPSYTLPTASVTVLGGIKVGARLSIDGDGVLSADVQSGGVATPPAGTDMMIQYNNNGAFGAETNFKWDYSIDRMEIIGRSLVTKTQTMDAAGYITQTAIGTYTLPAGISMNNGSVWAANWAWMDYTIGGSVSVSSATVHSANFNMLRLMATASGAANVQQVGARAISANAAQIHLPQLTTGVDSYFNHVAGMQIYSLYQDNGTTNCAKITNYYALLIADTTENLQSALRANIENKYAIKQAGVGDLNEFNGKMIMKNDIEFSNSAYGTLYRDTADGSLKRLRITNGAVVVV